MSDQKKGLESPENTLDNSNFYHLMQDERSSSLPHLYDHRAITSQDIHNQGVPHDYPKFYANVDDIEVFEEGEEGVAYGPRIPKAWQKGNL